MNTLTLDITNATPEQVKTILAVLNDSNYKPGQSDSDNNFHKDIKDIDDVSENYSHELYVKVLAEFDKYLAQSYARPDAVKNGIYDIIGDYEVRTGLSDDAYNRLFAYASKLNM